MATKKQIDNLIELLGKRKTRRGVELAEINIDGLIRNKKIKKILFKKDDCAIHIYTNRLYLNAPNGKKAYLGTFELKFSKTDWTLESWYLETRNIDNKKDGRIHPHGSDSDLCLGIAQEQSLITQLNKGNIYVAIDRYIQLLETFNLNDELCMFAGLWFRKKPRPYRSMQEVREQLGKNES